MLENELMSVKYPIVQLIDLATDFTNGDHGGVKYVEKGIRYLRGQSVTREGLKLDDELYITAEDHHRMIRAEVLPGDVLLTIAGSTGNACVVSGIQKANINQAIVKIRPKPTILSEYLAFFLNSRYGKFQTDRLANGSVQLNINFSEVGEIRVIVPPLDLQQRIVEMVRDAKKTLQGKINQADEMMENIDPFILEKLGIRIKSQVVYQSFAVTLNSMKGAKRLDSAYHQPLYKYLNEALDNCGHPLTTLGKLSPELSGGATPTRGDEELYANEGIKFLRIMNVKPNYIDLTDIKYITEKVHAGELSRSQLLSGDILVTITGRVGNAAVVTDDILPANINQHIVRLRVSWGECLPEYLAAYFNSSIGLKLSNREVTGGTRIALDYVAVRNLRIPLPPIDLQKEIINEICVMKEKYLRLFSEAENEWELALERCEQCLMQ